MHFLQAHHQSHNPVHDTPNISFLGRLTNYINEVRTNPWYQVKDKEVQSHQDFIHSSVIVASYLLPFDARDDSPVSEHIPPISDSIFSPS